MRLKSFICLQVSVGVTLDTVNRQVCRARWFGKTGILVVMSFENVSVMLAAIWLRDSSSKVRSCKILWGLANMMSLLVLCKISPGFELRPKVFVFEVRVVETRVIRSQVVGDILPCWHWSLISEKKRNSGIKFGNSEKKKVGMDCQA